MYLELKLIKIFLYILNIIPVVFCFLPITDETGKLACSVVSFGLTLINEVTTSFLSNYKEKAILEHQLYEAEITGSTFSKIEYDRETTNDLNELAIRKGLPSMNKAGSYPRSNVPQDITDDYSYLYLCRKSAAGYRYVLSRIFYIYVFILIGIVITFIACTFTNTKTAESLYLLVCFWPLIIPIIRDCAASKKCMRQCVKICADIDNFFADGDGSIERLARFYFYVQNIEFEMLTTRPVIFKIFNKLFNRGMVILTDGVTERFKDAISELTAKTLMAKGVIAQPKGKDLITKKEYDIDEIQKLMRHKKVLVRRTASLKKAEEKAVPQSKATTSAAKTTSVSAKTPEMKSVKPAVTTKKVTGVASTSKSATKPVQSKDNTNKPVASKATAAKTPAKSSKPKEAPKKNEPKTETGPKVVYSRAKTTSKTTTVKAKTTPETMKSKTASPAKPANSGASTKTTSSKKITTK